MPLTSVPVAALVDGVPHVLRRYEDIARAVWARDGGRGICTMAGGADPEAWHPFPSRDADPFSEGPRRERMAAARLCGPCPVRSQCLDGAEQGARLGCTEMAAKAIQHRGLEKLRLAARRRGRRTSAVGVWQAAALTSAPLLCAAPEVAA